MKLRLWDLHCKRRITLTEIKPDGTKTSPPVEGKHHQRVASDAQRPDDEDEEGDDVVSMVGHIHPGEEAALGVCYLRLHALSGPHGANTSSGPPAWQRALGSPTCNPHCSAGVWPPSWIQMNICLIDCPQGQLFSSLTVALNMRDLLSSRSLFILEKILDEQNQFCIKTENKYDIYWTKKSFLL